VSGSLVQHGVRLVVAYDGTDFAGFASQQNQRTVQGVLAAAAIRVCRHEVVVRGASRTDSGVHAEGQIAAFGTTRELEPKRWRLALNRYLPADVAVREVAACEPDYEPRFDARDKTYRYLFNLAEVRDPLRRHYAWHLGRHAAKRGKRGLALDLGAMRGACERLAGTHDFRAFRGAADARAVTVRTLMRVSLEEAYSGDPALLALEVRGNAFMLNMVRIIAGTLIDVGRGRLTLDQLSVLLSARGERQGAGMTAPAHGLTLVAVNLGRLREEASSSVR
jgi:tRNA pseudouridine38-40 synthase